MAGASLKSARSTRRRTLLLALLLACLIGLLATRPGLRVSAARTAERAAHALVFEILGLSPRRFYTWRLWVAGLYDAPLGQRWRHAADRAEADWFKSRVSAELNFAADQITARVFTCQLDRGMALRWRLERTDQPDAGRLYATLERRDGKTWHYATTLAANGRAHRYVIDTGGRYRLVFQPELAAEVHARLNLARGGSLLFPVVGGHAYDIGGGFGVPRDRGARRHQGVDIFADRNTPVRAVVDGQVSTGHGGLGGRYIFLSAGVSGPRFYYAHLDHFVVENGARVSRGEVIATVGNSGNAAGGPTHLHFGIYTADGAADPAPFIKPMPGLPDD